MTYEPKCPRCGAGGSNTVGGTYYDCGSWRGTEMASPHQQSEDCILAQADRIRERRLEEMNRVVTRHDWLKLVDDNRPVHLTIEDIAHCLLYEDWRIGQPHAVPTHRGVIEPKMARYGPWEHFACPECGDLQMLPWRKDDQHPWCIHGGAARYVWPNPQEGQTMEERKAAMTENDWTEMVRVVVTPK